MKTGPTPKSSFNPSFKPDTTFDYNPSPKLKLPTFSKPD
jgi:hypothetical protein